VQREHVVVLTGEDFVAGLDDQLVLLIAKPLAGMVCCGSRLLQDGIGGDHLTRNQVLADAEMLERALGLSTPQLIGRHFNHSEAICLSSHVGHLFLPSPIAATSNLGSVWCPLQVPCRFWRCMKARRNGAQFSDMPVDERSTT